MTNSKHNNCVLSEKEFKQILNQLSKGNIFEKAKILRDKIQYVKDNGSNGYIELVNQIAWCKNNIKLPIK